MNRYEITFEGRLVSTGTPLTRDEVEQVIDIVVGEFEKLEAEDIDISTNLAESTVVVSITTMSEDLPGGQEYGNGLVRTAFHAAEVATPGWSIDWVKATTLPETDNHPDGELVDA